MDQNTRTSRPDLWSWLAKKNHAVDDGEEAEPVFNEPLPHSPQLKIQPQALSHDAQAFAAAKQARMVEKAKELGVVVTGERIRTYWPKCPKCHNTVNHARWCRMKWDLSERPSKFQHNDRKLGTPGPAKRVDPDDLPMVRILLPTCPECRKTVRHKSACTSKHVGLKPIRRVMTKKEEAAWYEKDRGQE